MILPSLRTDLRTDRRCHMSRPTTTTTGLEVRSTSYAPLVWKNKRPSWEAPELKFVGFFFTPELSMAAPDATFNTSRGWNVPDTNVARLLTLS